jgi:hypothetical protein
MKAVHRLAQSQGNRRAVHVYVDFRRIARCAPETGAFALREISRAP